jgi:acetoin utilization deacetylase AcuC-like enzyme
MRKTALYYNDIFLKHLVPIGHPENNNRIEFILNKIKKK